jgi:hypothetical protein
MARLGNHDNLESDYFNEFNFPAHHRSWIDIILYYLILILIRHLFPHLQIVVFHVKKLKHLYEIFIVKQAPKYYEANKADPRLFLRELEKRPKTFVMFLVLLMLSSYCPLQSLWLRIPSVQKSTEYVD